jgi:putative acetyltransferase
MIIQECKKHQYTQVKNLVLEILNEHGFEYDPEKDYDLDNIEKYYLTDGSVFYIGIVDGQIVGTGALKRIDNNKCEIKRMYVKKSFRNRGYGLKLFNATLEFAQKHYKTATIKTNVKLKRAINLYLKNGFLITDLDTKNNIVHMLTTLPRVNS